MVPGHSQALQLFLSFLSSSLRPLFVRLVNARSWFYFPFAGPPAMPVVGAPGNTPEPSHPQMNSGDFYETYLPRFTGQILYRRTSYQPGSQSHEN